MPLVESCNEFRKLPAYLGFKGDVKAPVLIVVYAVELGNFTNHTGAIAANFNLLQLNSPFLQLTTDNVQLTAVKSTAYRYLFANEVG